MPVPFTCPHCGTQSIVADSCIGQSGTCFTCGKPISVSGTEARGDARSSGTSPYSPRSKTTRVAVIVTLVLAGFIAGVGLLALFVWLMIPIVSLAQQSAHRKECQDNLRAIAVAMQRYHDEHGHYPPAYIADENGKPKHSWRVLLLPHLGEQSLFSQYDMRQPWDSPQNKLVAQKMPRFYGCPSDPNGRSLKETSYVVLVGQNTMFPDAKTTSRGDIRDGVAQTIVVVETEGTGIGWTEPRDIPTKNLRFLINGTSNSQLGSKHPQGAHVLMADGKVYFLDESSPPDFLESLSTINGGEAIPLGRLKQEH